MAVAPCRRPAEADCQGRRAVRSVAGSVNRFEQAGWDAHGFDLRSGDDVRDQDAVLDAAEGCEVIVHAGAIAHDSAGTPADILGSGVRLR